MPIVQRLRYIRQNDLAHLVYPSLNTTRLEHSIGVFHLAGALADCALNNCRPPALRDEYLEQLGQRLFQESKSACDPLQAFRRAARWYGLLHDVGHLPFSHLTEHCLERYHGIFYGDPPQFEKLHESAGAWIANNDAKLKGAIAQDPAASWLVRELLGKKKAEPLLRPLKDILDSEVDADRIDSTARDGLLSGGDLGRYDTGRLTRSASLCKVDDTWQILFSTRAITAIESLLLERFKTYRWIHYHPKVVAYKNAYRHCFESLTKSEDFKPNGWHAKAYVNDEGYLDDARARRFIASVPEDAAQDVRQAKHAILFRTKHARPLWKRRDEFWSLSDRVEKALDRPSSPRPSTAVLQLEAGHGLSLQHGERKDETIRVLEGEMQLILEQNGQKTERRLAAGEACRIRPGVIHHVSAKGPRCVAEITTDRREPILNMLAVRPKDLEIRTNELLTGRNEHCLVEATSFPPFEPSELGESIGKYFVFRHTDDLPVPIRLTEESRMVKALTEMAKAEPGIGVAVLGDPKSAAQEIVEDALVQAAVEVFKRRAQLHGSASGSR